jgi:hypothetical protein
MEIWDYLKDNILPNEHVFAEQIVHVAKRYMLVEGDLYRRGANGVLMRCITWEDDYELHAEIHGGECGNHASSRTPASKAFQDGFYWTTTLQDVVDLVKRCEACLHTSADAASDPALMVICHMGAGHPRSVP